MERTRVRRLVAALLAAASVSLPLVVASGRASAGPEATPRPRVYVVEAGDSVWRIAVRLAGPGEDPRPLVDRVIEDNRLRDARIVPGQRLTLPAPP